MQFKTKTTNLKNKKFFKVKNSKKEFLCALCKAPRQMRYSKNLSEIKYIQIALISGTLSYLCYPFWGLKSLALFLIVWPLFELINKILYRREIPCSYCGFDATWYRRDVKVAKRKVEDFWAQRLPEQKMSTPNKPIKPNKSEENISESTPLN